MYATCIFNKTPPEEARWWPVSDLNMEDVSVLITCALCKIPDRVLFTATKTVKLLDKSAGLGAAYGLLVRNKHGATGGVYRLNTYGEKAMFNSDLDVFARTGFPQTAERIKEALRKKDEEIQTLRAALEQMKPNENNIVNKAD